MFLKQDLKNVAPVAVVAEDFEVVVAADDIQAVVKDVAAAVDLVVAATGAEVDEEAEAGSCYSLGCFKNCNIVFF